MLTVRLAKRNSNRIENVIKLNRLKIHLQMKNCEVLYHFHNVMNLDVFLIWKFFYLVSVVAFQCQSICRQTVQCCTGPNNKKFNSSHWFLKN